MSYLTIYLRFTVISLIILCSIITSSAQQQSISATPRGALAETVRFRIEFSDGVLISLYNKLTNEQYLDTNADLTKTIPHLPSGLGTQQGENARETAEKLFKWPWWEHPNNMYLPNQHYADKKSRFSTTPQGTAKTTLTYTGLTDGKNRFDDEVFILTLEIDTATGDLLVTPGGKSPLPGVYGANLTLAPLASAITAEAPITDGLHITRENTGEVLWVNKWPDYWQYGFIAFNGWKTGAVAIWAQDQKIRNYKELMYLKNGQGISFSLSMMNIPPFEKLTDAQPALPWRIQAFETSWAQAAERYRQWRDANVKMAPRPEFTNKTSFIASLAGPQDSWLKSFLRYTEPWQGRATAFQASVRAQSFDRNHADNTPYKGFKEDTAKWRAAGTYGMSYLQPMIMWGPFPEEVKMVNPEREKAARTLSKEANTRLAFQKDANTVVPYIDQHHLGHPGWQRWFLDWVKEWCQDYNAQGIYHDQSYHAPLDRRGLTISGMTSPEGMADYFYKVATENPGTFHGTEMVTEANAVAVSNAIGSGYHWGTAPNMRMARAYDSSPVTAALCYPHTVLWSFVRLRGDSTWDLRERRMQEARGQIAGAIDGPFDYNVDAKWWPAMCNTPWHDRTRDVTFLKYGLRPYYPAKYNRDILSYFHGAEGEEFRYEKMSWGSRFVQIMPDKTDRLIYGVATGVQAVPQTGAGIANWIVYNSDDPGHTWNRTGPAGLHPDRWYVIDPNVKRPAVWFSTTQGYGPSFYESYIEDCGSNDYTAFLKLRTIDKLSPVTGWEQIVLHSPAQPAAVYVNGKKTPVKLKDGTTDEYPISVKAPSDIVVMLKQPPAALKDLSKSAILRLTETEHPVDYYHTGMISNLADGGIDEQQRPVLQDAAVSGFGFNFGGQKYIYVPISAPIDSKGGTLKLHLPLLQKYGQKWNHRIEAIELNLQPFVRNISPQQRIPDVVEIPLNPGEVKLLTLRTQPFVAETFHDFAKVTTKMALEWVEK
jgi:hypothetical protein